MKAADDIPIVQDKLTKLLLEIAEGFNISLDFSEKSIEDLDKLLQIFYEDNKDSNADKQRKDALYGIALEAAAYIVTTIQRKYGKGEWARKHEMFREETWPFTFGNLTIFPVAWCLKQIENGKVDSVAYKYREAFLAKINS
jgi:hypothetical protein